MCASLLILLVSISRCLSRRARTCVWLCGYGTRHVCHVHVDYDSMEIVAKWQFSPPNGFTAIDLLQPRSRCHVLLSFGSDPIRAHKIRMNMQRTYRRSFWMNWFSTPKNKLNFTQINGWYYRHDDCDGVVSGVRGGVRWWRWIRHIQIGRGVLCDASSIFCVAAAAMEIEMDATRRVRSHAICSLAWK